MATNRVAFTSPVGRIVQGDAFEPQTKDQQGNLRVVKTGPNAGQPAPQNFIAVAFRKDDPAWPAFMGQLYGVAARDWPTLLPQTNPPANVFGIMVPPPVNPNLSFKVKDGDGVDRNGKSNAEKDGFAGHWIVSFASQYPPKVVRPVGPNAWEGVTKDTALPKPDGTGLTTLKRGHYVRVAGSLDGNGNTQNPGIYVNLDMIEWVGIGAEIVSGPDAASAFGAPAALPAGVAALPTGGAAAFAPPVAAGAPPAYAPPVAAGAPPVAAGAPPAYAPPVAAAAPYAGYMAPAGNGAPIAGAPSGAASYAPPATLSPTKVMTPAANGAPYENFIAQGWTDEMMVAQGFMILQ